MIITQKKPIEEVMAMVADAKTVAIVGCGSCATACQTGGEPQIAELTAVLEQAGKKVVATTIADYCCMNLGVKAKMKPINAANPDCVICMSCGDGVQCVAKNAPTIPVYPSNNTMYLGEAVKFGVWEESCRSGNTTFRSSSIRSVPKPCIFKSVLRHDGHSVGTLVV